MDISFYQPAPHYAQDTNAHRKTLYRRAPHPNPHGTEIPCPHIHIYREDYDDKCAYPTCDKVHLD